MSIKSAGPQLNQTRDDFNKRVGKKSILGKSKKSNLEFSKKTF